VITGIGVDLVEIPRMEKILKRWGLRFLERVFTPEEIRYCREKAAPAIHYAARFAAKEASLKSLGIGLGMGLNLTDIGVTRTDKSPPRLFFSERGVLMLREGGICRTHLSLTHTQRYAMAMVVMEKQVRQ
jgi:holo-[acyl-carrier protein] synthase